MKLNLLLATVAAAGMLVAANANAATPIWEFSSASASCTNGSWDFGNNFSVSSTVEVVALGYYNDPTTGVSGNPVALYDSNGNLLASATVNAGDPQVGHFLYASITPVLLAPGEYQIDGVSNTSNYTWNDSGFHTASPITYLGNTWQPGTTPDFQNSVQNDVSDGYWGPNALMAPEPSTWAMMGLGFAGLAFAGCRTRRTATAIA